MKSTPRFLALALAATLLTQFAHAGMARAAELDSASSEALVQTTRLLKSAPERDKAIKADPQAQNVDQMVRSIGGTAATTDEIYGLSAEVFETITKEAGGDPIKMQEIIQKANQDPKGFYAKYFNESNKAKLQGMTKSMSGAPTMAREPASAQH